MKLTPKEKKVIQDYLNYYYNKYSRYECVKKPLSFKNQMNLLYDHLTNVEEK